MKISEMLKREDFYTINEETLKEYYANTGNSTTEMYIYPKLNAIVTSHPGEKVKNFLLTEYSAQSPIKNIIARTYVKACLSTKGLLADNEINVKAKIGDETLIYPCNKKYRIFDFENNTVSVIIKKGFKKDDLTHEIEYRKNDDLPSFVPKIIRYDSNGYTEEIIHGKPVARIRDRQKYNELKKHAYTIFREHYNSQDNMVSSFSYIEQLEKKIHTCASLKCKDFVLLNSVV